jgi:hypothetical protein
MTKYRIFLGLVAVELATLLCFYGLGAVRLSRRAPDVVVLQEMAEGLMLTDLAIWSEATYARHPSQADLFSPFQEYPSAIEHFPSGSILAPPFGMRSGGHE